MALGIENLKKAAKLITQFGMQLETSTADGWQTIPDIISFIGVLSQIPEVLKQKQLIIDEYKDLSKAERLELSTYIETELNLKNKRIEEIIESGFETLVSLLNFIEVIKKKPVVTEPGL